MRFSDPPRRMPQEPLLPMINVVFLLLIFFLIAAQLSAPDPVDVVLPGSSFAAGSVAETAGNVAFLDSGGVVHFGEASGGAALEALREALLSACEDGGCDAAALAVVLRADAAAPGAALAALLPALAAVGAARVDLVTIPGRGQTGQGG